ncbi:ESPR-type extended signal peptide-containing protein [Acinetobacter pullicarnis]|uniref:ESPR-type extended signal peptide-containing protein n=1 Tax=Acinetobacter pullicarnis TaxID=2576829 RepID=UPI00111F20E0|nr:ESPR-type extended signal peptide-containing protein [Acinetobacter pullicarnis]
MNKIYRVIWNASIGAWVAVSELAKSKSKSTAKTVGSIVAIVGVVSFSANAFAGTVLSGAECGSAAATATDKNGVAIGCNAKAGEDSKIADRKNPYNTDYDKGGRVNGTPLGGSTAVGSGALNEKSLSVAIGTYAHTKDVAGVAIGVGALSGGNTALALGRQSAATADFAQAIGNVAAATGKGTLAIGHSATATGYRSIAIGSPDIESAEEVAGQGGVGYQTEGQTKSTGKDSIAFGGGAQATQDNALSIGAFSKASGKKSVAIGTNAIADKDNAVVIGDGAKSTVVGGVALGMGSQVNTDNSAAIGLNAIATAAKGDGYLSNQKLSTVKGVVSVGKEGELRRLQNLADGAVDTDGVTVAQLKKQKELTDKQGKDTASNLGGGSVYNETTGGVSAPTYNVGGKDYKNVGAAITAVETHYLSVNDGGDKGGNFNNDGAKGKNSMALGVGASSTIDDAIAIGLGAKVQAGSDTVGSPQLTGGIALGAGALATQDGISIGRNARSNSGEDRGGIAIGQDSFGYAYGVAIGLGAVADQSGTNADYGSVAIGSKAKTGGSADGGVTIGANSYVEAEGGVAIGQQAKSKIKFATALGGGAVADREGGVALGSNSVTDRDKGMEGYVTTQASESDRDAILATTATHAAVSVGGTQTDADGNVSTITRQITNVAAGTTDSDAVNVAQLKSVENAAKAANDFAVKYDKNEDDSVNKDSVTFASTTATPATKDASGKFEMNGGTTLNNVASAGDYKNADNAYKGVNAGDLNNAVLDTTSKGLDFVGNSGEFHRDLGQTVSIKGAGEKENTEYSAANIKTIADEEGNLVIALDKNLTGLESVTVGDTSITTDGLTINNG